MSATFKPISKIEADLGIEVDGPIQYFFTHTCMIHMDKYVPYDTGTLANTAYHDIDYIVYQQKYAKVVYYGVRNGKELNYHKDKHPLAGPYWDKRMVSAEMGDLVQEVQDYINLKRSKYTGFNFEFNPYSFETFKV